jgi:hypothetical protein
MKIVPKTTSKYLRKADLAAPVIATIDRVSLEQFQSPTEEKYVLHFSAPAGLKPMTLNVRNTKLLVARFGDDDAGWRGRLVEIYVDPDVADSRGEIVGGIRLRIPASAAAQPPAPLPPAAAAPVLAPAPVTAPVDLAKNHALILAGLQGARSMAKVDEWMRWAARFQFMLEQRAQHNTESRAARARIEAAAALPPDKKPAA